LPNYLSEAEFLAAYNIHDYPVPLASVDVCIFTLHQQTLKVLLVKRKDYPHKDRWALAGGFIDIQQDTHLENTALRTLSKKTGVTTPYLEQLATIGNGQRDPRGWSMTAVYFALIPYVELLQTGTELSQWCEVNLALDLELAFDHRQLLSLALERVRAKVLYTLIPAHLISSPFTLTELQRAYEIIMGHEIEKKSFRRRLEREQVLNETGQIKQEGAGRPAALYTLKPECAVFNFKRQLEQLPTTN
jgi:ADP-ribose pyrophosphatase YjhB (NUDIX family)